MNKSPTKVDVVVSARVKLRRKELGMTQSVLGANLGVTLSRAVFGCAHPPALSRAPGPWPAPRLRRADRRTSGDRVLPMRHQAGAEGGKHARVVGNALREPLAPARLRCARQSRNGRGERHDVILISRAGQLW